MVWNFAGIQFVPQVTVHYPTRPGGASDAGLGGIDARDAIDQPIGVGKIEPGIDPQQEQLFGGTNSGTAHATKETIVPEPEWVVHTRYRQRVGEVFALHPKLKFARFITSVRTDFKGADNHDLGLE